MREHIETFTSPSVAVPITTTTTVLSTFMDNMPMLLNIGSFIYLILLITHKAWQMYKEWKNKSEE